MRFRVKIAAVVAAALFASTATASAQTSHMHLGAHAIYNTTFKDAGLGAQFSLPIAPYLELYPSVDFYFESGATLWQPNLDIKFRVLGKRREWLYVGTGVGLLQQSYANTRDDRAAWNLFAGIESIQGNVHPFLEARASVSSYNHYQVQAGLNFTLGRAH